MDTSYPWMSTQIQISLVGGFFNWPMATPRKSLMRHWRVAASQSHVLQAPGRALTARPLPFGSVEAKSVSSWSSVPVGSGSLATGLGLAIEAIERTQLAMSVTSKAMTPGRWVLSSQYPPNRSCQANSLRSIPCSTTCATRPPSSSATNSPTSPATPLKLTYGLTSRPDRPLEVERVPDDELV